MLFNVGLLIALVLPGVRSFRLVLACEWHGLGQDQNRHRQRSERCHCLAARSLPVADAMSAAGRTNIAIINHSEIITIQTQSLMDSLHMRYTSENIDAPFTFGVPDPPV